MFDWKITFGSTAGNCWISQHTERNEGKPSVSSKTFETTFEEAATFDFIEDQHWEAKSDRFAGKQCNHQQKWASDWYRAINW